MTRKPRNTKAEATCPELAYSSGRGGTQWPHTCGKPVKRGGYCGIHANMNGIPKDAAAPMAR